MSKIALITGATAGIGKATATAFAADGWNVIITGRREERLQDLKDELEKTYSIQAYPLLFDVSDRNAVDTAFAGLHDEWKEIDVLVNNAGLALGAEPIEEGTPEDWDTMIDTNIKGVLYVTHCVVPKMIERKSGHIINLGSIAGKEVYRGGNIYCATKHAIEGLTKGMRIDLLPYGIKVTSICPGAVETEFSKVRFKGDAEKAKSLYKGFDPLRPEDIADAIFFVATRPAHVNINDLLIMPTAQANVSDWHKE